MARTKQTARKSSGGKADRRMWQPTTPNQWKSFMTAQQCVGTGSFQPSRQQQQQKTSYLNYENTFYSFAFHVDSQAKGAEFHPSYAAACSPGPLDESSREAYVGVAFHSKYDGEGMKEHGRPNLDLVVTLDISGSMNTLFEVDQDEGAASAFGAGQTLHPKRQNKLQVAKECLLSIMRQLRDEDRFGLTIFNSKGQVVLPLTRWSEVNKDKLTRELNLLNAAGGTSLYDGLHTATLLFKPDSTADSQPSSTQPSSSRTTRSSSGKKRAAGSQAGSQAGLIDSNGSVRSKRILFLTDMISSGGGADEVKLLEEIRTNADRRIWTSVMGIGSDLNVGLVERISTTPGCFYSSVCNGEEFRTVLGQDFDYDVTAVAYNIELKLISDEWEIVNGYGSPEVYDIKNGIKISTEFPVALDHSGNRKGGVYLFKLAKKNQGTTGAADAMLTDASLLNFHLSYTDMHGVKKEDLQEVVMDTSQVNYSQPWIRKAVALTRYIDTHNGYINGESGFTIHQETLNRFTQFKTQFQIELESTGDDTLQTSNQSFVEILDKIIQLEQTAAADEAAQQQALIDQQAAAATADDDDEDGETGGGTRGTKRKNEGGDKMDSIKEDLTCPVCLELFTDPVTFSCLHNFCKGCTPAPAANGLVNCPVCRKPTPVADVKENFMLKRMASTIKSSPQKRGDKKDGDNKAADRKQTARKQTARKQTARKGR
eukprot:GILJ01004994.1.p1 GENE.GILJ01004994.1~~GILJ01004994.1.p1  ORF type:complete len:710 (+),score=139.63 GILJ01004994.1:113-2242(+)